MWKYHFEIQFQLFWIDPKSELLDCMVVHLILKGDSIMFTVAASFLILPTVHKSSNFFTSLFSLLFVALFYSSHPKECEVTYHFGLHLL